MLQRWEVLRIWCPHLIVPHDKFCITVDPIAGSFLFINSNPPPFRKARALAVQIESFEAGFLNHTSFVDTTTVELFTDAEIASAYAEADRQHGLLIGAVRDRIRAMVESHQVMPPASRAAILAP